MRYLWAWVPLIALGLSCAHTPAPLQPDEGDSGLIREAIAAELAKLEDIPLCLPSEWADARPVAELFKGERKEHATVRARGVFRPAFLDCSGSLSLNEYLLTNEGVEVLGSLQAPCSRCIPQLRLVDAADPAFALAFELESVERTSRLCAEVPIQERLAEVPVLIWGRLQSEPRNKSMLVKADRSCRGPIPAGLGRWSPRPPVASEPTQLLEGLMRVADENEGKPLGQRALMAALHVARTQGKTHDTRVIGERILRDYGDLIVSADVVSQLARDAMHDGHYALAARCHERAAALLDDEYAANAWRAAGKLKFTDGDLEGAIRDLEQAAEASRIQRFKVDAFVSIAQWRWQQGQAVAARAMAEKALAMDPLHVPAAAMLAEVLATTTREDGEALDALLTKLVDEGRSGEELARAIWFAGELHFRTFKAISPRQLEEKRAELQRVQGVFRRAASLGVPEWEVASGWRIGVSLQLLADESERAMARNQAGALREQAAAEFEKCAQYAKKFEVFTTAAVGCRTKSEEVKSPFPAPPPPRSVEPLHEGSTARDFEARGLAYLAASKLELARTAFDRAIELEYARASAHSALGYAWLVSGNGTQARQQYQDALQADPDFAKARANLAALRCRFGDSEGARRELAMIKDLRELSGPDVDPEWTTCRQ